MLLSEAWKRYQQDKKIEGYSSLTLKTYCFQYKLLLRFFGDIDMNEFNTDRLKEYLIRSGDHLKPSSLDIGFVVLNHYLGGHMKKVIL